MKDGTCEVEDKSIGNDQKILSAKEKDALQEAGNIAAAYAATALSKIIGDEVMLDVTECKLILVDKIPKTLGKETNRVVAVNMLIPNRDLCSILMLFPHDSACQLCDIFYKLETGTTTEVSQKELDALTEIGNICICAYLNALSKLLGIELWPAPPAVASDMIGSILEEVAVSADAVNEYAILIETNFIHKQDRTKGHFLFLLDKDSKEAIFKVFKVNEPKTTE
jgi:chemotaxis protein CheC